MNTHATTPSAQSDRSGLAAISRVTLADVAQKARVASATASRVLNNAANCWASEATRQRIQRAAQELGYRPNLSARALRSGCSRVIGLISPGFGIGTSSSRAGGLTEAAAKSDYTVILSSHPNDSESEDLVIRRLLDRGVDGLAIYPVDTGPHRELHQLVQSGFPVVTFEGANLLEFPCDDISADLEAVGKLQAKHLRQLGRRRICLANTAPHARINAIRETVVRQELERAGTPPLEMHIAYSVAREVSEAELLEAPMRAFLKKHCGAFDGVIGIDSMASLTIRILQDMGWRVPEDVSVLGTGNGLLASYGVMALTSVGTADDEAGAQAFGLLMDRIHGRGTRRFRRLISRAQLTVRKSTQA